MNFKNIIGNEEIKTILENTVKSQNILHSYLFLGPEGIGKKLFAKEFAKMILCTQELKSCNQCKSCIEFDSDNNPDFSLIEPEGNTLKIEKIREMLEKVSEKPIIANKKVYIIDNSDLMTKEAQNCLLKTLEEPPEYVTIILIGTNENKFLNTIKSRCTKLRFQKIEDQTLKQFLMEQLQFSNVTNNMLKVYDGSIKKAILLKDKEELYNEVEKIIQNIEKEKITNLINGTNIIYKNKEDINDILDNINRILFEKVIKEEKMQYIKPIEIVENTKKRISANSNFDMTIDKMLLTMWESLRES